MPKNPRLSLKETKMEKMSGLYLPEKLITHLRNSVEGGYFANMSEASRFYLMLGMKHFLDQNDHHHFSSLIAELKEITMYREKMEKIGDIGIKKKKVKQSLTIFINIDIDYELIDWVLLSKKINKLFPNFIFIIEYKTKGPLIDIDSKSIEILTREKIIGYFCNQTVI